MTLKKDNVQEGKAETTDWSANNSLLLLSGRFYASGMSNSGLRLYEIPEYYKTINVASAVLVNHAVLEFEFCSRKINRAMLRDVRREKKATVLLSVGGNNGNINYLNQSGKVANIFNSLSILYQEWGFDGVNFELHQVDIENLGYIIKTIQWFHESFPQAIISIGAGVGDVCPGTSVISGKLNKLVPLLNALNKIIHRVQIRTYGNVNAIGKFKKEFGTISQGDDLSQLENLYKSFVAPFPIDQLNGDAGFEGVADYPGIDASKIVLEFNPLPKSPEESYLVQNISPDQIRHVLGQLRNQYNVTPGGIMMASIEADAAKEFQFTTQLIKESPVAPETVVKPADQVMKQEVKSLEPELPQISPIFKVNLMSKLRELGPKEIFTDQLWLRPFTVGDIGEVQTLAGDSAVSDATMNIPYPLDHRKAEQLVMDDIASQHEGTGVYFAIVLKKYKQLIGSICLVINQEHQRAEMRFWIGKEYWNNGYCTEAASVMLEYGFKKLRLNRIFALHFKSNQSAAEVLKKIGMNNDGCMAKHFKKKDTYEDVCFWGLLKEEFLKRS